MLEIFLIFFFSVFAFLYARRKRRGRRRRKRLFFTIYLFNVSVRKQERKEGGVEKTFSKRWNIKGKERKEGRENKYYYYFAYFFFFYMFNRGNTAANSFVWIFNPKLRREGEGRGGQKRLKMISRKYILWRKRLCACVESKEERKVLRRMWKWCRIEKKTKISV